MTDYGRLMTAADGVAEYHREQARSETAITRRRAHGRRAARAERFARFCRLAQEFLGGRDE